MNVQVRDLVLGMVETNSLPCVCDSCEIALTDENVYSPFATVCKGCTDAHMAYEINCIR